MTESKALVGEDFIIVRNQALYFSEYVETLERENRELRELLKNAISYQEKAKSFLSHYDDCNSLVDEVPDDECCMCGMDEFAHDNYISIEISKKALENKGGGNG